MKLVHRLVAVASYYKFDGWLINIENKIEVDAKIIHVFCPTNYR